MSINATDSNTEISVPNSNIAALWQSFGRFCGFKSSGYENRRRFRSRSTRKTREDSGKNRFQDMLRRVRDLPEFSAVYSDSAPYGSFCDRPIIGVKSTINGGVYLSAQAREALVVDDRDDGKLARLYDALLLRYVKAYGGGCQRPDEAKLVAELVGLVQERLRYVPEVVVTELLSSHKVAADQKISLDLFVKVGIGTDRHQLLLAAYLLEKCRQRGLIETKVVFDCYCQDPSGIGERLIITTTAGEVFYFVPSALGTKLQPGPL